MMDPTEFFLSEAFQDRMDAGRQLAKAKYGINCMEVTEEVFDSYASIVFDQADNHRHPIKAIPVVTSGS